ncbi:MAG: hypothetical protein ACT4NU_09355 [Chromatiales bacterium]
MRSAATALEAMPPLMVVPAKELEAIFPTGQLTRCCTAGIRTWIDQDFKPWAVGQHKGNPCAEQPEVEAILSELGALV